MSNHIKAAKLILQEYLKYKNIDAKFVVEIPRRKNHGHLSTNLALILTKLLKKSPIIIAEEIIKFINKKDKRYFSDINFVQPGFINFWIDKKELKKVLFEIKRESNNFGSLDKQNFKYNIEIVSANPTGFLHIGHARNAAIGDSVCRILKFAGYDVEVDYYTNDAGNQIKILALTVFYDYLESYDKKIERSPECYKGNVYENVAREIKQKFGDKFVECDYNQKEILDSEANYVFKKYAIDFFMKEIKKQLKLFRVTIDNYISEESMYENNKIKDVLDYGKSKKIIYEENQALWLATSKKGDDKDRVLVKSDGTYTYFLPDLAGHIDKIKRTNPNKIVNFWGGDHHGYVKRMSSGLSLYGYDEKILSVDIIQMVRLIKNGEELKMSKRKGTAIWLLDIVNMIGVDATRYMLSSVSPGVHMDFDISLMENESSKNPVFYLQYATARCHSILKKSKELKILEQEKTDLLGNNHEIEIMLSLDLFSNEVYLAAQNRMPSIICDYIQKICKIFHSYYNEYKILDLNNLELSGQRIFLVKAVLIVLQNALNLIGINDNKKM